MKNALNKVRIGLLWIFLPLIFILTLISLPIVFKKKKKNPAFQCLNFWVLKPILTRSGGSTGLRRYEVWFLWQIRIARLYGGAKWAFAGDSNEEVFCNRRTMSKYETVVLVYGKGGTTVGDWPEWFTKSRYGRKVYRYLRKIKGLFNIGGNNCLKNQMATVKAELQELKDMLPQFWNTTIPPVRSWMLDLADPNRTAEDFDREMAEINGYIREIYKPQVLDMYETIVRLPEPIKQKTLKDPVHFSKFWVNIISDFYDQFL